METANGAVTASGRRQLTEQARCALEGCVAHVAVAVELEGDDDVDGDVSYKDR